MKKFICVTLDVAKGLAIAAVTSALLVSSAHAAAVDLALWSDESYPAVSGFGAGVWTVSGDGLSVNQSVNGQPTLFVSDFVVAGLAIEGMVIVNTAGDDDLIGFALGFIPGDADPGDNTADYLLVDWKQATQGFTFGPPSCTGGSTSLVGLAVSRVTGIPTADEFWGHFDEDAVCSPAGEGLEELQRATNLGATGWADNTAYTFKFEFTTTSLVVFVNGVEELNITGTFNDGSLAFYNFSQSNVTYSAFETQPLLLKALTSGPDRDGSLEIDLVVPINVEIPTAYDFTITYDGPDDTPVVIDDRVPAEWDVTDIEFDGTGLPLDCGDDADFSGDYGDVLVFRGGKSGKKCNSDTGLMWTPGGDNKTLNVQTQARCHDNKNNNFCRPTSCGALYLNYGAVAYETDGDGELVLDVEGNPIVVLGPTDPICLAAVDDVDGDGTFTWDGSGDEDGDNLSDYEEACAIGTDPCLFDTDDDGINDDVDECPLEGDLGLGVDAVGCPNVCENHLGLFCPPEIDGLYVFMWGGFTNNEPPCPAVATASWDWGDGNVDYFAQQPDGYVYPFPNSHTYGNSGAFEIEVTLFEENGTEMDQSTCEVSVSDL